MVLCVSYDPENQLLRTEEPDAGPCSEPNNSSPHFSCYFSIRFNIILPRTSRLFCQTIFPDFSYSLHLLRRHTPRIAIFNTLNHEFLLIRR